MAYDKVVDSAKLDADLTMVADAIRDTGVTDEQIAFPDGYKENVDAVTEFLTKFISRYGSDVYNVMFPKGLTEVGAYAFCSCQWFHIPNTLPEGIKKIGNRSFMNVYKIVNLVLPSTLESIGEAAFNNNLGLLTVTFKSTPTSIHNNAFSSCAKLITINVPWAEGAVANAPWGATNATINYNYTGEG